MPVSTRSQIFFNGQDDTSNISSTQRARPTMGHQETHPFTGPSPLRNPHHGLKEKMKALTLMYEQQKQAAAALRSNNNNPASKTDQTPRFSTHPSVELFNSCKKDEETDPEAIPPKPNALFPPNVNDVSDDLKENNAATGTGKIVGFSCPRRNGSVRKLSMGNLAQKFEAKNGVVRTGQELETSTANTTSAAGSEESRLMINDSRILVFVRLRPMGKKEKEAGSRSCVRIVNKKDVYLTEFASENDYLRLKRLRGRHFTFDSAFPDSTSQQEVYSMTTAELVEGVLQGRNGSVFCYGATGAGKTYTMLGTLENPGVMVLAIKGLFTMMRQRSFDGHHSLHLSYLEVYNETVRDLLSPGRPLVLREDKQGIVAAGLTQYRAYSTDEVMSLLQRGNQNRTTEPTRANETSSRSHAILQIVAEYQVRDAAMNIMTRVGKLSLIDLAGSERALATDQRTLRSIEGANINRSLLALSSCINALVEGKRHIPYRNSKLTQLLKDSLGGACNTVMIANISPSNISFGETQNTLHWADRAKQIRTKACETVAEEQQFQVVHPTSENTDQAKLLLELQKENRELRVQLARQQQKLLTFQAQSLAANSSSPTPSSATTSILSPPPPAIAATAQIINEKRWTRSSILAGNCFNTPESKRRVVAGGGGAEEMVRVLQKKVKALEAEVEKMKTDHALQIKQKDEIIRAHLDNKPAKASVSEKRIVTRASLRAGKSTSTGENNELKSPSHRFLSPAPTAKKRSFWDITTTNSPLTKTLASRKTRSSVGGVKLAPAPSMLLQPGFAREKACVNEMGK